MKILIIGLDSRAFEPDSKTAERLRALSAAAGSLTVIVPGVTDGTRELGPNLAVHSVSGGKLRAFFGILRLGRRLLAQSHFDLISVQDAYFLALLGYWLSRKFRVPLELQVHGFEKLSGLRRLLASFLLPRADAVRVVSERLKKLLTTNFRLPATRLYELPIYSQVEVLPVLRRPHSIFNFLTVGRLVPVKNVALLIEAFGIIAPEFQKARLVIAGAGPLAESLKLKVRSLKFEDKVIIVGEQKNLGQFYEEADAFVLASRHEGWGLVVVEAAAYSLPIVMTDVGLAGEFIRGGENGLIVPVGDRDALARAMAQLIREPELAKRLGQAARRACERLPSPNEQIKKQVEIWRKISQHLIL